MWQWENATAGAVAAVHPLDVVRTRFQGCDRRGSSLPTYKNTVNAIFTIGRMELWQSQTKISDNGKNLSPRLHLVSAAEAGALVCFLHKSSLACENKNAASESSSSSTTLFWAIWSALLS